MTHIIPDTAVSASSASRDVRKPDDGKLTPVENCALYKIRSVVEDLTTKMRNTRSESLTRANHALINDLFENSVNWSLVIAEEQRNIDTQINGQSHLQTVSQYLRQVLGISDPTMSKEEIVRLKEDLWVSFFQANKDVLRKFEVVLLKVFAQVYFDIPRDLECSEDYLGLYSLSCSDREKIISAKKLNEDTNYCCLVKLHELTKRSIYKQEETPENDRMITFSEEEGEALYRLVSLSDYNKNMMNLANKVLVLDRIEKARMAWANNRYSSDYDLRVRAESNAFDHQTAQSEKMQSIAGINLSNSRQDKRSRTITNGVQDTRTTFRPPKKRFIERANKDVFQAPIGASVKSEKCEHTTLSRTANSHALQQGTETHSNNTISAVPNSKPTLPALCPWLSIESPLKVAPDYVGKKPKITHTLIPHRYSHKSHKKIGDNIQKAVQAHHSKSYKDQEAHTKKWVKVKNIGSETPLSDINKALRNEKGGFSKKKIVLKYGEVLCLGFYRGVLIDSAEKLRQFRSHNPHTAERLDQYSFDLLLDEYQEGLPAHNGFIPIITPLSEGHDSSEVIGRLPYINTYLKRETGGILSTDAEKVNVQAVNIQTSVGQKNGLFDLIAYVIVADNPNREPTIIQVGEQFFVDYGQKYNESHFSPQPSNINRLSHSPLHPLDMTLNARFPLNYLDREMNIQSSKILLAEGDKFKISILEDKPIIGNGNIFYVEKKMNSFLKRVKESAEKSLNSSESERAAFLKKVIAIDQSRNDGTILAGSDLKPGMAFILTGVTHLLEHRAELAKHFGISEKKLDENSIYLHDLNLLSEAERKQLDGTDQQSYLIGCGGRYQNFLINIPDVDSDSSDADTGNMGMLFAHSSVAEPTEPPDCVIFYTLRHIPSGTKLVRLAGE